MPTSPHSPSGQTKRQVNIEVPDEWLPVIDDLRGQSSRSAWIREMMMRAFYRRGITGLPAVTDNRGCWDRLEHGKMGADRAKQERRRRKRNAYLREWRKTHVPRPKPAPPPVEFTFHDDGTVHASDLAGMGTAAGYVSESGVYRQESRHRLEVVYQALKAAMAMEPLRAWPCRYRRFVQRFDRDQS